MSHTLTLNDVPAPLFERLRLLGLAMNRTVEAQALSYLVEQLMPRKVDDDEITRRVTERLQQLGGVKPLTMEDCEAIAQDIRRCRG